MWDTHRLARTFNYQGLNSLIRNDVDSAQKSFYAALKMAYEGGWIPAALDALAGLTVLSIHQKTRQEVLELVLYILEHPTSAQETKNLVARLQVELEAQLSKEEIEAAQLRAGSKILDEIVRQFLADDGIISKWITAPTFA